MSDRTEQLRAAFAARLERVRGAMSDDEFARLVDDVLRTAQRFEEIDERELGTVPKATTIRTFQEPEIRS